MSTGVTCTLEKGQSAESVAAQHGVAVADAWAAPENASIKKLRMDPHLMAPGDVVFVPVKPKTLSLATGQRHKIVVKLLKTHLKIVFRRLGEARANIPYVLNVDGKVIKGQTDGDGAIDCELPALADHAHLELSTPKKHTKITLGLRTLGPISEREGWCARLRNLGYDAVPDQRAEAYLCAFQADWKLDETGVMDDKTRQKLADVHGC